MWWFISQTLGVLLLVTVATPTLADKSRNTPVLPVQASPGIHGLEQAWLRSDGARVARKRISGTGHISEPHVIIDGTLEPGNSPGCITFGGDVTFNLTAALVIEIGGGTPCTEHDQIDVANQLTINSATLEVILINGFVPAYGDTFDIMNWGNFTGSFGIIDTSAASLPAPLQWDTSQLYVTGELVVDVQQFADGDLAPWDNPDGIINTADVLIAEQLVLGLRIPGALQYAHGDMNTDGIINVADLILIIQTVL